jgi:hypothetical protein
MRLAVAASDSSCALDTAAQNARLAVSAPACTLVVTPTRVATV